MRAVLCKEHGPEEKLALEEVADPTPKENEVLVEMHASALNFPDVLQIRGKYQFQPPLPHGVCNEGAGIVLAVGDKVSSVKPGDRVIAVGQGALAEKMVAHESMVIPMPDAMDFRTGAAFTTTYGTSYHALKQRANIQPGETLLVLGAGGGVGTSAVELGKAMGATVIAAASTDEKLAIAKDLGADHLINYSEGSLKDKIKELTGGKGADVVYDPVGGDFSEQALRATAWNGRFLVIGFAAGEIPKIPLNLTLLKGCSIVGVFWGAFTQVEADVNAQNIREMMELIVSGKVKPLINDVFKLEQYVEAFNCLSERRARGKVIVDIR
jgi:NADPH2:quinone reductase